MGEARDDRRDGYRPALDGVRALAVALVLAFHLGVPGLRGGYLGVSVFFTLSGFLITTLLLEERARTGRIDIRAFYLRRLRRLLPASLLCLTGVAVLAGLGAFGPAGELREEILGALLQAANWRALLGGESYADLFAAPSPVEHFWSLAIEEQFYVLWPVAVAGITAIAARRGLSVTAWLTGCFVVFALSAPLTARWWSADATYLASWPRFAEILAGAVLAAVLAARPTRLCVPWIGGLCLVAIVAACVVTPAGRGWAYAGGLPVFALVSAGLIAGLETGGPVARLLSLGPVAGLGRVSYGVYLFHWPLFLVLDERRTGMDGVSLGAVRLAATLLLAWASFRLVEAPIRYRVVLARPTAYLRGAGVSFAVVLVALVAIVPAPHERRPDTAGALTIAAARTPLSAPESAGPPVVAVFGDSVPDWLVRDGSVGFARTDVVLVDAAHEGCDASVARPLWRDRNGNPREIPAFCEAWPVSYAPVVAALDQPVDTAVLVVGQAVIIDRLIGDQWVGPCGDMAWYREDIAKRITFLQGHVDRVVLALPAWGGPLSTWFVPDDHLVREGCVRDELRAAASNAGAPVVDLADVLCPDGPAGACPPLREGDGLHVDPDDAPMVLDWLLDAVLEVSATP